MSMLTIGSLAVAVLLSIGLPILLFFLWQKKYHPGILPMVTGAVVFFLFVLVLESMLHNFVLGRFPVVTQNTAVYVMYACLAAGVFEEIGRYVGFQFLRLNQRMNSPGVPLHYGVGHGGLESILLVGIGHAQLLILAIMMKVQGAELLIQRYTREQNPAILETLSFLQSSDAWSQILAAGFERVLAMTLHIALSVLVWMIVTKKLPFPFLFISILLHALTNVPAMLFQRNVLTNVWLMEAVTALVAVGTAIFVAVLYRRYSKRPQLQF